MKKSVAFRIEAVMDYFMDVGVKILTKVKLTDLLVAGKLFATIQVRKIENN